MPKKHQYEIAFVGLKPGDHEFEYELDEKFFEQYGETELIQPHAVIKVHLEKHSSFMQLRFDVAGKTTVVCDRCSNNLEMPLWDEFKLIIKLTDDADRLNEEEEDPDVHYLNRNESMLNIADWLYEFTLLALPLQRMCSPEQMGGPQCNQEVLQLLKNSQPQSESKPSINPLWENLKNKLDK
jgi:uncharacterized metal-binding protein YceD (DUF177 family)